MKNKEDKTIAPSLEMFDTVTDSNIGERIELDTKTGDKSGVFITIRGTDSDAYREFEHESKRVARKKFFDSQRRGKQIQLDDPEEEEKQKIDLLVILTVCWENMPSPDGGLLDFNVQNARMVYTKYPAIRRQIEKHINEDKNFTVG